LPRPGIKQGGHRAGQGGDSYYLDGFGGFLATLEDGKTKMVRLRRGDGVVMARLRPVGYGVARGVRPRRTIGLSVRQQGGSSDILFKLSTAFVNNCRFFCRV